MSARMTGLVFERYPGGGGEMLLALALADHAHDDGSHIYLLVDTLAEKTRQSARTVRYQLAKMRAMGWLLVDGAADGGRSRACRYRINSEWIKNPDWHPAEASEAEENTANIAGFKDDSEAKNPAIAVAGLSKCVAEKTLQPDARNPAIAVAGAIEPYEPNTEIHPLTPKGANQPANNDPKRRPLTTFKAWLAQCRSRGEKPIPPDDQVFALAETMGLTREMLQLQWGEFKRRQLEAETAKRQRDWRRTFRNSVRGNWYRLWWLGANRQCELTTTGRQAQMLQDADAQQAEVAHGA